MTNHTKSKQFHCKHVSNRALNVTLAATCLLSSAAVPLMADDSSATPSKVNALVSLEFANEYLTPRGLIVVNQGLTAQPLVLGFVSLYKGGNDSFINSISLVPGVWADFSTSQQGSHQGYNFTTRAGGQGPEHGILNEIDPIFGVTTTFAKNFTLGLTYTAFISQEGQYPTSQHLETKLSFNDGDYLKAFALHPTLIYWQELQNKATVGPIAGHGPSEYFDIGIAPSYTFEDSGLKVELPIRTLIPVDNRFYGRSGIGLYEVGGKATIPMKFMPQGYGSWSFHLGVKYMKFLNGDATSGLIGMNNSGFLAEGPGSHVTDTVQVYAGVSTFF